MTSSGLHDRGADRLLILAQTPPPWHGSNVMADTILQALRDLGIEHEIVQKKISLTTEEVERFRLSKVGRIVSLLFTFRRRLRSFRPDRVLIFNSTKKAGVLLDTSFLRIVKAHGIPVSLYVHGVGHDENQRSGLFRRVYRLGYAQVDSLIVLSEALDDDVAFLGRPTMSLANALAPAAEAAALSAFERRQRARPTRFLFLGNLYRSKGVLTVLRALSIARRSGVNVRCRLVGRLVERDTERQARRIIQESDLADHVELPGPRYGDEKYDELSRADVFVFPTQYPVEAMPMVLLEAMCAGMPVVASDVGAISRVVTDGQTGYVISPGSAEALAEHMIALAQSSESVDVMGQAAHDDYMERFSYDRYVRELRGILERLSGSRG